MKDEWNAVYAAQHDFGSGVVGGWTDVCEADSRSGSCVECVGRVQSFRTRARGSAEGGRGLSIGASVEDGGWQKGLESSFGGERLSEPGFEGRLGGDIGPCEPLVVSKNGDSENGSCARSESGNFN